MGAWPALFVAHGSPMLALEGGALADLGPSLTAPRAILVCSAHWEVPGAFRLSSTERPGGLHDFGGFPEKFYALDYPARPLDHGAWAKAFQGWVDDRLAVGDTPREYTQLTVQSLLAVHTVDRSF
jgi:aromatic ring-opening dioxygenase catalytic subunit (LigB family)